MPEPPGPGLAAKLATLRPKTKPPSSATVLNNWIAQAERFLDAPQGGRLGWLVASTVTTAVLQRAVTADGQGRFLLKGGTMLQHRLNVPTRATKDIDGLVRGDLDSFIATLDSILADPWGPIGFKRSEIEVIDTPTKAVKPLRLWITLSLRGITWRRVQVELSPDEGNAGTMPDPFPAPQLAGFGLPEPGVLIGLSLSYQTAQKLHAVSDPHQPPEYVNDRARDLVDLLLLKGLAEWAGSPTTAEIRQACVDIFAARCVEAETLGQAPRPWPPRLTAYPHWPDDYSKAAQSADIDTSLEEAISIINTWITQIDQTAVMISGR
jgi:hypothetical protein